MIAHTCLLLSLGISGWLKVFFLDCRSILLPGVPPMIWFNCQHKPPVTHQRASPYVFFGRGSSWTRTPVSHYPYWVPRDVSGSTTTRYECLVLFGRLILLRDRVPHELPPAATGLQHGRMCKSLILSRRGGALSIMKFLDVQIRTTILTGACCYECLRCSVQG